ncbi:tetratricopeptide repeat protein [Planctellipticum variicoloris]|uniref:tetratricopeptide repeat protein n=1 Tax=Planctellipticum variicoloris TaxID=3064265 RepID=UPI003013DEB5|nr:tetratricopeptide repeat protein [Planctomycetaceae bacterium SH412]
MTRAAMIPNERPPHRRLITAAIWLCAILTAAHPLSSDGLWWELSKGRAFVSGSWNPTADLIAGTVGAEADWLSGVIPYLVFSWFGLSGLMWLKLACVLAITGLFLRRVSRPSLTGSWLWNGVLLVTTLIAARQAWEPGSVFFDTLGLVLVYLAAEQIANRNSSAPIVVALLLLCLWSNFGPRCIVGIPVVLINLYRQPQKPVVGLGFTFLMLGACCLTPAGWRTPLDSLCITVPQTIERTEILTMAGWHPWWDRPARSDAIAFVGLSAAYVLALRRNFSARILFVLFVAHALAAASPDNLPMAAIWIALVATSSSIVPAVPPAAACRIQSRSRTGAPQAPGRDETAEPIRPGQPVWPILATVGVVLCASFAAVRPWDDCGSGLGWGIDPRIGPDAFAASLAEVSFEGNAHCVGLREAGLLSWHEARAMRPYDTPTTALLNRRLREHVLLTRDLSDRWQIPHRRADGSWGGWWTVLRDRGTTALVVPSEDLRLVESLEPTIWKPLSLNAVSLVYGKAGDPGCTRQIVETLSVRQMVDRGVWTYQPSSEESSSTVEFLAWFREGSTTFQGLRLARVFRAMQMHIGSLKVLHSLSDSSQDAVREEFYANQLALGYQERLRVGRSSELRLRSSLLAGPRDSIRPEVQEILSWPAAPDVPPDDRFRQAIRLYVERDITAALAELPEDRPEALYAKAQLLLEAGEPRTAQTVLRDFLEKFPDHRLSAMAQILAASLVF